LSSNPDAEERTEPLGVRRPVELPEVDTESADDLAPASGTEPVTEDDRSASGSAAEVSADSGDAEPASGDAQEADSGTRPEEASPSGNEEQNLVTAQEAAAVAPSDAGADKADGTPPDRPKKPILAAVAIGGAVLLAIPLLLIGTGSHNDKKHQSTAAANNILSGGGQQPPPGAFVSTSPSVTPTPSATVSPKAKKAKPKASANNGAQAGPATSAHSGGSRLPTGPKFSTVTRLLLHNVMTGLCADVPNYGNGQASGPINEFTCDGTSNDNQLWDLVVNDKGAGPNGADLFTIRNSKDNYCFDLPGTGTVDGGTHVIENACVPGLGDNQMWYLDKRSSHRFWIRNSVIHKWCLDVAGVDGAGGKDAPLTVFPCDPKDDHLWSFS
jgi:hypothetical protein